MISQLTAGELRQLQHEGRHLTLVDVREPDEFGKAHIDGAELIPLRELSTKFTELHPNKDEVVVIYGDHGVRALHAATLLRAMGYKNVADLRGGLQEYDEDAEQWRRAS